MPELLAQRVEAARLVLRSVNGEVVLAALSSPLLASLVAVK